VDFTYGAKNVFCLSNTVCKVVSASTYVCVHITNWTHPKTTWRSCTPSRLGPPWWLIGITGHQYRDSIRNGTNRKLTVLWPRHKTERNIRTYQPTAVRADRALSGRKTLLLNVRLFAGLRSRVFFLIPPPMRRQLFRQPKVEANGNSRTTFENNNYYCEFFRATCAASRVSSVRSVRRYFDGTRSPRVGSVRLTVSVRRSAT